MSSNDAFSVKSADTANERRCTQCQVLSIVLHTSACAVLQIACPKRSQKATVYLCPVDTAQTCQEGQRHTKGRVQGMIGSERSRMEPVTLDDHIGQRTTRISHHTANPSRIYVTLLVNNILSCTLD